MELEVCRLECPQVCSCLPQEWVEPELLVQVVLELVLQEAQAQPEQVELNPIPSQVEQVELNPIPSPVWAVVDSEVVVLLIFALEGPRGSPVVFQIPRRLASRRKRVCWG